jgi:Zn-dependent protease
MFQNSLTLMRIVGIDISITPSWFLIAALITWSLADQIFPAELPGLAPSSYLILGLVAMVLFFTSLVLHELAHAAVARAFGLEVPSITLFLFGGVAEIGDEPSRPDQELWIALAGPAMSISLAVAFWFLSVVANLWAGADVVATVLSHLAIINLALALFNLLPAFPLDGGRVLRALLWSRSGNVLTATEAASRTGEVLAIALIALGILNMFQGGPLAGAWQILIGSFILLAARSAVQAQRVKSYLGGQRVSDLMSSDVVTVEPDVTLSDLVNRIMLPNRVSFVPVIEQDVLLGHINTEVLGRIDRENWANTKVGDVFVELDPAGVVSSGDQAADIVRRLGETGRRKLLVVDNRRLTGVVTMSDLSRYFALLAELHWGRLTGEKG